MSMLRSMKLARPSLRQMLFGGVGSSLGVLGLVFMVALYLVEMLTRPKKKNIFDDYTFSPFELDLPAEVISFPPLRGDYKVGGWYIPAVDATSTILVCPGYRSRKADLLGLSALLWRAGHNVLVFDFYGHGTEVGSPVTLGYREINDFQGAVAYAKARAPHTRLGAIGYSMGAAVTIMCAARDTAIEAVVADSAFATHLSAVDYNFRHVLRVPSAPFIWMADYLLWWRAGYRFHQVEPIRDIGAISPSPILIIHGGKDSMVDPHDAQLLFQAAQEPKELWFVPEADHCGAYFVDRPAYTKRIRDFFDLHLRQALPTLQIVEPQEDRQPDSLPKSDNDLFEAS